MVIVNENYFQEFSKVNIAKKINKFKQFKETIKVHFEIKTSLKTLTKAWFLYSLAEFQINLEESSNC